MKKLMIAACAVAFAAVAQAASINWAASDVVASPREGGDVMNRYYTGYSFFTELGGATEYTAVTMAQIEALAQAGNWAALEGLAVNTYSTYDSGASEFAPSTAWASATTGNPITVKGFTLLVDADLLNATGFDVPETTADIENYALSAEGTQKFQNGGSNLSLANSFASSEWKAVAVPEPTSGLLLLIGMAGLALRRRRA